MWYEDTCTCGCSRADSVTKQTCARDVLRHWDDFLCSCVCRDQCPRGQTMVPDQCRCVSDPGVSQCAVSPLYSVTATSLTHPAKLATYVGLVAIALVTLTILITLYMMATKKRPYRDLRYPRYGGKASWSYGWSLNDTFSLAGLKAPLVD